MVIFVSAMLSSLSSRKPQTKPMVDQRSDLRALASLQPRSPSITEHDQHFIPFIILSSPRKYQFAGCHNAIFWGRGLTEV